MTDYLISLPWEFDDVLTLLETEAEADDENSVETV